MKLVICEKPSLAKTVANAIGIIKTEKGYYLCKNDYYVSFVFGHILSLRELKHYPENQNKPWQHLQLPYVPSPFVYEIPQDSGIKAQFQILKKLVKDSNMVIHCGDADREGQIIIDNFLEYISYKGIVKRLWLPEQTEESIREQLLQMKDNTNYQLLNQEGKARTYLDWLYGMNLSVYLTVKSGTFFAVGRVLVPIVKFIYDRDMEIKNFKPTPYFTVENKNKEFPLKVKEKFQTATEAQERKNYLNQYKAFITKIEEKQTTKNAPKLFSLSTLQSLLSTKYKMNFASSLKIIQSLYEKGYITYPRTNTEYLATNEATRISELIYFFNQEGHSLENKIVKRIYDDSKIESHSAITPTKKIPKDLTEDEEKVYSTILNRFLSVFCKEECILSERTMFVTIKEENFELKGRSILKQGFLKYEPANFEDTLPNFSENQEIDVHFEVLEKMTESPPKMTEAELSSLLRNPFRKNEKGYEENENSKIQDDQDEYKAILKGIEIGTEATRTGIIENAKKNGYITQEKNKYSITTKGMEFVDLLNKLNIPLFKEKSVELSVLLKKVYKAEKSIHDCIDFARGELSQICSQTTFIEQKEIEKTFTAQNLGSCPKCKGVIILGKYNYFCTEKCGFKINNEIAGVKITEKSVKELLSKGITKEDFAFFSKKNPNSKFFAKLEIKEDKSIGFVFLSDILERKFLK